MFIATGTYRIERGQGTNDFGDSTDVPEQVFDGIPLAMMEKVRSMSGATNFTRERIMVGRGRPRLDIIEGDRVVSEQDEERFVVTQVSRPGGLPVMGSDVRFECSRMTPDVRNPR